MIFGKSKPTSSELSRARVDDSLPTGVRIASAWSWRLLVIAGAIGVFIFLIMQLRVVVIPLMIAVLVSALLVPFSQFLQRHRWPGWLSIITAFVTLLGVFGGLVVLIVWQVRVGLPDLQVQSLAAWEEFKKFLLDSPLHLTEKQITEYGAQVWSTFERDSAALISGAMSLGSTAGTLVTGMFLVLFATVIILIGGKGIWAWIVRIFPRRARAAVDGSGLAGWATLTEFVKVQVFVAAIDAVGIGIGAAILQLPLVIPIAIAVFLGSFIPIIGAVVTGALAVFIALIYKDVVIAIIMLGIVLLVQQVESHVLQPLIMGSAVKVHPLAIVLAVAAGGYLAGIPGALFAVPVVATLNAMISYIARGQWREPGGVTFAEPAGRTPVTARKSERHV